MPSFLNKRHPDGKEEFLQYNLPGDITLVTTRFDKNMSQKIILAYCAKNDAYTDVFECPAPDESIPISEIDWRDQLTADNYLDQAEAGDEMTISIRRAGAAPTQYILEHFVSTTPN